jgi:signal transduction histidine kinase
MMTHESADADEQLGPLVHALRTPLTIVEGFSDALMRRGERMSAEERAEYAERIHDAAEEMRGLLDDVRR